MHKYFIFLFIIFAIFSCKKETKTENDFFNDSIHTQITDTSTNTTTKQENDKNVFTIKDTSVIFFMPSSQEQKELTKIYGTYDQYQMNIVYKNFINLKNLVKRSLSRRGIGVQMSYAKKFIIPMTDDTLVYDLNIEDQIMGYILFDGENMPVIKNGVQTKKQVTLDIRNYFNLKNFNLNE